MNREVRQGEQGRPKPALRTRSQGGRPERGLPVFGGVRVAVASAVVVVLAAGRLALHALLVVLLLVGALLVLLLLGSGALGLKALS